MNRFPYLPFLFALSLSACGDNAPLQGRKQPEPTQPHKPVRLTPETTLELYVVPVGEPLDCQTLREGGYALPPHWLPVTSIRSDSARVDHPIPVNLASIVPSQVRLVLVRAIDFSTDVTHAVACVDNLASITDKHQQLHLYLEPV